MNTLLENAIQEAMAELDKKSEVAEGAGRPAAAGPAPVSRRAKRHDRVQKDKHHKKKPKAGEGTRLRSTR